MRAGSRAAQIDSARSAALLQSEVYVDLLSSELGAAEDERAFALDAAGAKDALASSLRAQAEASAHEREQAAAVAAAADGEREGLRRQVRKLEGQLESAETAVRALGVEVASADAGMCSPHMIEIYH